MDARKNMKAGEGMALLAVLLIVMAITVLALGFLSRSDVELACGRNMALRTQMDYLAESGLEHARGLILNPQDVASEYWTGETNQQLVAGDADYYDVTVVRDETDPTDRCNFIIDCNAYRLDGGEKIGRSNLRATLRVDPCIVLWTENNTSLWSGVTINGDVRCNGELTSSGTIDGDVYAAALNGSITGSHKTVGELSLLWPRVTAADFTSHHTTQTISSASLSGQTLGPFAPPRVFHRSGGLTLAGNVQIDGMLVVEGNLAVQGNGNTITAGKNMPAVLVTGDLTIESNSNFVVNGLVVVDGSMHISADAVTVGVTGGLFVAGDLVETTADETGNNTGKLLNGPSWYPAGGYRDGTLEFNGDDTAVEIGTSGMNPLQGTVSLWCYSLSFNGSYHRYLFGHTSSPDPYADRIQLYASAGGNQLYLGLGDTHNRHENIQALNTHTWYHIALTWNGTDYVVYVNGAARATGSYSGLSALGAIADIGNTGNSGERIESWHGLIDDVRIYNRVLDANEVYPPSDGLAGEVGYWKLDESGSTVTVTAAPSKCAIKLWTAASIEEKWSQAPGAFFKSIERR